MDYAALATALKAQFSDWESRDYDSMAAWRNETTTERVPRSGPLWLNARTMASLFPTLVTGGILRGTEIMENMRAAGTANALMRDVADWMGQVSGSQPGIDIVDEGVWGLAQALFPSLGMTTEELSVVDHWRTRKETVSPYDVGWSLKGEGL